jgi:chaperonin GroEL
MVEQLKAEARIVVDQKTLEEVAVISANGDVELGSMIAKGMFAVGPKGVMSVNPSGTVDTYLDMVDGIQLDMGYISPYMVTDVGRREAVLDNPFIMCYDDSITELKECLPLLEEIAKRKRPLLIICKNIGPEALVNILTNAQRGILQIVAIRMPGFGDTKLEILKDVAVLTGTTVLTEMDTGIHLCDAELPLLGEAKRVRVSQDKTVIIQGTGDKQEIQNRIGIVEQQIQTEKVDKIKKDMIDRLGGLQGKVAVLHVGATTESELREKVARVDDAIQATRAALQEGIVRGGGVALLRAKIPETTPGAKILNKVAMAPYAQICNNAGVIAKLNKERTGYNLFLKPPKDMFEAGVIDPLRVVRVALENAVSIAGLILTTEAVVRRVKDVPEGINLQRR